MPSPPPPATRPGGRSARVRDDVLAAVRTLLGEGGFDAVTIDATAARSGVHRATVYRRWGSPAMLVADLLAHGAHDDWAPADTGSLEGDLVALNREVQASLAADRSPDVAVIAASFRSPEAATALRRFWEDRYARAAVVVERAQARGEVPAGSSAPRILVAATGPLYHQRLFLGRPLSVADADAYARSAARSATTPERSGP